MNLRLMRTKSKVAPQLRESKHLNETNHPLIALEETKEILRKKLQEDERKIKDRNPKKQMVSEEKWSEGTSWMEIIREGERREKEAEVEEEGKPQPEVLNVDKAMLLMVKCS